MHKNNLLLGLAFIIVKPSNNKTMKVILILIISELLYSVFTNETSFCKSERKAFLRVSEIRDSLLSAKLDLFFQHAHWINNTLIHK